MNWARESCQKQKQEFQARREVIRKKQNESRLNKLELKKNKERKANMVKQFLIENISKYGGLWLNVDVDKKYLHWSVLQSSLKP